MNKEEKNNGVSIFGQSHSNGIGVCVEGLETGFKIDLDKLRHFMKRRAPGQNEYSTPRKEGDEFEILSGLVDDTTLKAAALVLGKKINGKPYGYIPDSFLLRQEIYPFALLKKK